MRHFVSQKDRREDACPTQTEAETVSVQSKTFFQEKSHKINFFLQTIYCIFFFMYLLFVFQVCVRPFVVKHIDNLPTFPVPSGETSSFSGHMVEELEAEQEEKENIYNVRINHQHASRQKQSLKPPRLGKWLDALRSASLG